MEKVSFENHKQILSRTNTRNAERKFQGAKVPGSEWSWERKVQLPFGAGTVDVHLYKCFFRRAAYCVALCLSVCLSVCPVIVTTGNVFSAPLASQVYFRHALSQGRIQSLSLEGAEPMSSAPPLPSLPPIPPLPCPFPSLPYPSPPSFPSLSPALSSPPLPLKRGVRGSSPENFEILDCCR